MVVANSQPLVTTVPINPTRYLLGEVTNQFQPTKLSTWGVTIPSPLLGNEAKAGFAAFTSDGIHANRGISSDNIFNLVGFFENQYFGEWDPGSVTGSETVGDNFLVSVCQQGTICVYNSSAIGTSRPTNTLLITSVTPGTTPPTILVGSLWQGPGLGADVTFINVTASISIVESQPIVGGGVLINVLIP